MKNYKQFINESVKDFLKPKSDDKISDDLFKLPVGKIIIKCVKHDFIKGFKYLCDNNLVDGNDKYIIEKYKLGLHQDEPLKDFEIFISNIMDDLTIKRSNINENYILYKNNNDVLFSYLNNKKYFFINKEKICWKISYDFKINNNLISIFIKDISEKKLNLIIDDIFILDNNNFQLN